MNHKTRLHPAALGLAFASWAASVVAGAQLVQLPAAGRFVLPVSEGNRLLAQCSRPAPQHVIQFWQPSADEIDELEIALEQDLEKREKAGKPVPAKNLAFHRQYIGFIQRVGAGPQEELFIYGNFYPAGEASRWRKRQNEAAEPVSICDGGNAFWEIVYNPSTKTIEGIQFNGFA
jgi:hypothetical protein